MPDTTPVHTPTNRLKRALREGRPQIGFWLALGDATSAEISAGAGFDWLLIDGEHAPHDLHSVLDQLRAIGGYPETQAVVRTPSSDPVLIKQTLDLGVQTLLVPMVESAAQAQSVVRASRYPPAGSRGIGGARAARWGGYPSYLKEANDEICVIVQIESREGLRLVDAIAAVDGVDGVFIGPADLAASLGFPGAPGHEEVQAQTLAAFERIRAAGKAAGILTRDEVLARRWLAHGATLVAVGIDAHLLAAQARALAQRFKSPPSDGS